MPIGDLMRGQYIATRRPSSLSIRPGWSRDMTADITDERADDLPRTMAYRTHWSSYSRWQGAEVWTRTLRTSSRIIKVALFFCGFPTTLLEFRTSHHC